jgi:hypothetical protein
MATFHFRLRWIIACSSMRFATMHALSSRSTLLEELLDQAASKVSEFGFC